MGGRAAEPSPARAASERAVHSGSSPHHMLGTQQATGLGGLALPSCCPGPCQAACPLLTHLILWVWPWEPSFYHTVPRLGGQEGAPSCLANTSAVFLGPHCPPSQLTFLLFKGK